VDIPLLPCSYPYQLVTVSEPSTLKHPSPSHIATDGQSVSKSWCQAPSGAHDQIFITVWHLRCFFVGPLSDERTGLPFVYAAGLCQWVFLGSESLGTWDHVLLSQIWIFHFRNLLRLARSRWRYSTPPPHGDGSLQVQVKVILRLTISQSVSLGIEHPPGAHDQIYIFFLYESYCPISMPYF
jgi:hypothetical protein